MGGQALLISGIRWKVPERVNGNANTTTTTTTGWSPKRMTLTGSWVDMKNPRKGSMS